MGIFEAQKKLMKTIGWLLVLGIATISASAQNLDWAHNIGTIYYTDDIRSMVVDNDGNIYTTGGFVDTTDFDPGPGTYSLTSNGQADIYIHKKDSSGNLIWVKSMGGTDYDYGLSIYADNNGFIYVAGTFNDIVDFDPGAGTSNGTSNGSTDIFTLKMDTAGNFIWKKTLGGIYTEDAAKVTLDASGNIITTGSFQLNVDFDPGPGTDTLYAPTVNTFFQKLDNAGNYIWSKNIKGISPNWPADLTTDPTGYIYTTGIFQGTITDFDPGPDSTQLACNGYIDTYILKLDDNGNFVWVKQIGGLSDDEPTSIKLDNAGNIYTAGYFEGTMDLDPGTSTFNFVSAGDDDAYLQKLSNTGDFIWAKQISGAYSQTIMSIEIDNSGSIYAGGHVGAATDFDGGPGTYTLPFGGQYDVFLSKYNSSGNLVWAKSIAGSAEEYLKVLEIDNYGGIYIAGEIWGTTDFDPGPGTYNLTSLGFRDIYTAKYSGDQCSNLALVIDTLHEFNCITYDAHAFAHAEGGISPYNYVWNTTPVINDSVAVFTTGGIYTLDVVDQIGCANSSSVLINSPLYFSGFDLNANLVTNSYRPAFVSYVWLDVYNDACDTTSATVTLVIDSLVEIYAINPTPDLIVGDSIIWNLSALNFATPNFSPTISLITDTTAAIGDSIHLHLSVIPIAGDIDSTNNFKSYVYPVINGYDPNDKQVYPVGECTEGYIDNDEKLTYTIRFQNTGNADAINIHVIDTLPLNLDLNTVRVIGNSHPLITEIMSGNILNFKFDNIHLPDSTTNEVLSHGYVIYEVMSDSNLANGSVVENTAYIYFDFNPAVITNTTFNTMVDVIPACPNLSGIELPDDDMYLVYPNPTSSIINVVSSFELKNGILMVSDINGKKLIQQDELNGTNFQFDISELNPGMYFFHLYSEGKSGVIKVVKE